MSDQEQDVMELVRKSWDECADKRWDELQQVGAAGVLENLRQRNAKEELTPPEKVDDCLDTDIYIAMSKQIWDEIEDHVLRSDHNDLALAIFTAPGFIIAAHNDEPVLRLYLEILIGQMWRGLDYAIRNEIVELLLKMHERRVPDGMRDEAVA